MSNSIANGKTYVPFLDLAFKEGALTADLLLNQEVIRLGANGKDILVPKISLQGLGATTRGGDYVGGDVTFAYETITPGFDRSRMFKVDAMDNLESAGQAFGAISGEFIRMKVVPEWDAYVFATLAGTSNILSATAATLDTAAKVITAINTAQSAMDEAEVPMEGRILYITPSLLALVTAADTTASREVFAQFAKVVKVPQTRFYTAITQYDGSTSGQEAGGYIKNASTGKDVNFMIVHPTSVLAAPKHVAPKIVDPNLNQDGDYWKFGYRIYAAAFVFDNKVKGVYLHNKA